MLSFLYLLRSKSLVLDIHYVGYKRLKSGLLPTSSRSIQSRFYECKQVFRSLAEKSNNSRQAWTKSGIHLAERPELATSTSCTVTSCQFFLLASYSMNYICYTCILLYMSYPPIQQPIYLSVCLSACLSVQPPICLSVSPWVCPSIYLSIHLSILSIHLSVTVSARAFVHLSASFVSHSFTHSPTPSMYVLS